MRGEPLQNLTVRTALWGVGLFLAAVAAGAPIVVGALSLGAPGDTGGVTSIRVPTGPDAGMYSLASDQRGGALLSWLERTPSGLALRFSSLERGEWTTPTTIVEGRHLFANWADHPSIAAQPNGTLVAQWPVINDGPQPPGSYNNSMRIAMSTDRGKTWREVFADGLDNTHSYTGFVTLLPDASGLRAVYLTPPRPISHDPADHRMTLSHVLFDAHGARVANGVVDGDTCSCCPTAIGMTTRGPIAAYRDHEPGEVRDIAVVRLVNGSWTPPRPVHRDGWVINGCPTNGPALATGGSRVAIAWFTGAENRPAVKVAFSSNNGDTFTAPVEIDGAQAVGRPAIVLLADGAAAVAWLASVGGGRGELRVRRVTPAGEASPVLVAGPASPGRLSGMPQLVQIEDTLLAAWRGDGLQTVRMPIPR